MHCESLCRWSNNVATHLVSDQHKRAYFTYLPPLATDGLLGLHSSTQITCAYAPCRPLCSSKERRLELPFLHTRQSQSRRFSFTVPRRWKELPTDIRAGSSLSHPSPSDSHCIESFITCIVCLQVSNSDCHQCRNKVLL